MGNAVSIGIADYLFGEITLVPGLTLVSVKMIMAGTAPPPR